ncbi:MAG: hypothetical protein CMJ25_10500 [Phycisphaerae bacterium]|nr:hypothetical protein [Phycisphaerae bacterium]
MTADERFGRKTMITDYEKPVVEDTGPQYDPNLIYYWDFTRDATEYDKEIISNGDSTLDFIEINSGNPLRPQFTDFYGNLGIHIGNYTDDNGTLHSGNTSIGISANPSIAATFPTENFTIQMEVSTFDDKLLDSGRICDLRPVIEIFYNFNTTALPPDTDGNASSGLTSSLNGKDIKYYHRQTVFLHDSNGNLDPTTQQILIRPSHQYRHLYDWNTSTEGQYPMNEDAERHTLTLVIERYPNGELWFKHYTDDVLYLENRITTDPNYKFYYNNTIAFLKIKEVNLTNALSTMVMKNIKIYDRVLTISELTSPVPFHKFRYHFVSDTSQTYKTDAVITHVRSISGYNRNANPPIMNKSIFTADVSYTASKSVNSNQIANLYNNDWWIEYDLEYTTTTSVFAIQMFNNNNNTTAFYNYYTTNHDGIVWGIDNGFLKYRCGSTVITTTTAIASGDRNFYSVFINQNECKFYYNRTLQATVLKTSDPSFWNNNGNQGYFFGLINSGASNNVAHFLVKIANEDLGTESNPITIL